MNRPGRRPWRASGGASLAAMLALWACAACDKTPAAGDGADGAPTPQSASSSAPEGASASPEASASAVAPSEPMQLLDFAFTSDVKGKEPVDRLEAAESGMRVWAHLKLRNRSRDKRVVHLSFEVNGESRTAVDLDVEPSWSYRTWAYNTLRKADKTGEVALTVTDDSGATIVARSLPIRAKAVKKPAGK